MSEALVVPWTEAVTTVVRGESASAEKLRGPEPSQKAPRPRLARRVGPPGSE